MSPHDAEHSRPDGTDAPAMPDPETLCEEIEAYIVEKPFQSLAMALLAGIIVGKIIL